MNDEPIWNPAVATTAGIVLGCIGTSAVAATSGGAIDAKDWLQFAGALIGAMIALGAAALAWKSVREQIAAQRETATLPVLQKELDDIMEDIAELDAADQVLNIYGYIARAYRNDFHHMRQRIFSDIWGRPLARAEVEELDIRAPLEAKLIAAPKYLKDRANGVFQFMQAIDAPIGSEWRDIEEIWDEMAQFKKDDIRKQQEFAIDELIKFVSDVKNDSERLNRRAKAIRAHIDKAVEEYAGK